MVYSSAASSGTVLHIHDAVILFIEPAQVKRSEVDGEDAVADGFESDAGSLERCADEDFAVFPAESVIAGDATDREVARVLKGSTASETPGWRSLQVTLRTVNNQPCSFCKRSTR